MIRIHRFVVAALLLTSMIAMWVTATFALRPDLSLQNDYRVAAVSWASAVGTSDRCLKRDGVDLILSEAKLGASQLRPGWPDRISGEALKEYEELKHEMRLARLEGAVDQDQCFLAASIQGSTRTALITVRERLVRDNEGNKLLSAVTLIATEEGRSQIVVSILEFVKKIWFEVSNAG